MAVDVQNSLAYSAKYSAIIVANALAVGGVESATRGTTRLTASAIINREEIIQMSVKDIIKGAGKTVEGAYRGVFPEATSPNLKGPFQRLTGKGLQDPSSLYQSVVPYHLANKYSIPLVAGGLAVSGGVMGVKSFNQSKLGHLEGGEGLSGMTDGTIAGASANVVTPGLKELNDASSPQSRQNSARVRDNMQHNINTSGAEGDIVFALHEMR